MANIQSAKENIRKNRRRAQINLRWKVGAKKAVRTALSDPSSEKISLAQKALAKAAQRGPLHPRKAARLTSRLMKKSQPQPKKASKGKA